MSGLPEKPRRIWLRSFYGFNPEEDGYIGWTEEPARERMLGMIEDGDLFLIYGAASPETARAERKRIIGFLEAQARPILDIDKASAAGMKRKRDDGNQAKWVYAIPVVRAWRPNESILLERIAPETYRKEAGQAIAVWSAALLPEEVEQALKIRVTETSVFGEPPLSEPVLRNVSLAEAFRPSRAFPGSFGERTSNYEDGPTVLYLARFEGDSAALMGSPKNGFNKKALIKIGVSNNVTRRVEELNAGFPPAAIGIWKMQIVSQPFNDRQSAEAAEQLFKDKAERELTSLGGEFFEGDWMAVQSLFARIPGVSRFGR